MKSRKYPTVEAAYAHLESIGELKMFGRAGTDYEFMVCRLIHNDGREFTLYVYRDGNVVLVR